MSEVGSALTALAGAAGAWFTVLFTNMGTAKRQQVQLAYEHRSASENLLRERGEELYEQASHWVGLIQSLHMNTFRFMYGKLTHAEATELSAKTATNLDAKFSYSRMKMLVDIYYPMIKYTLENAHRVRDELSKNETKFLATADDDLKLRKSIADAHDVLMRKFDAASTEFKAAIAGAIREQLSLRLSVKEADRSAPSAHNA